MQAPTSRSGRIVGRHSSKGNALSSCRVMRLSPPELIALYFHVVLRAKRLAGGANAAAASRSLRGVQLGIQGQGLNFLNQTKARQRSTEEFLIIGRFSNQWWHFLFFFYLLPHHGQLYYFGSRGKKKINPINIPTEGLQLFWTALFQSVGQSIHQSINFHL